MLATRQQGDSVLCRQRVGRGRRSQIVRGHERHKPLFESVIPLMRRLCSFSLAPDTCVRKTETSFQRLGWKALVVAKFVPGLALFAAPVAGALPMPFAPFLVFATLGRLFYNTVVIGLCFAFPHQLPPPCGLFLPPRCPPLPRPSVATLPPHAPPP